MNAKTITLTLTMAILGNSSHGKAIVGQKNRDLEAGITLVQPAEVLNPNAHIKMAEAARAIDKIFGSDQPSEGPPALPGDDTAD